MPVSDYTPDVDAVAAFIRARTKTRGGAEAGTFNPANSEEKDMTRPTAEGVQEVIDRVMPKISNVLGVDVDPKYQDDARSVAALRAALIIELTYWPEQVATNRSPYAQLKTLFDEDWKDLLSSMGIAEEAGGGATSIDAGYPSYGGFPTTAIGMEQAW